MSKTGLGKARHKPGSLRGGPYDTDHIKYTEAEDEVGWRARGARFELCVSFF